MATDGPGRAPATDAAAALLTRLVERGLRHIVLSPGSRSQGLALVAAELEARGLVRLHVRIDERVAGFTALGIGREDRMPAVVVCTSGTAVANFLPAVLEAHHSGVPLLLLTADRPPELRGIGANQATRQPGMFSGFVRLESDLPVAEALAESAEADEVAAFRAAADVGWDAAVGSGSRVAGPVHLNIPFREPLAGELPGWVPSSSAEDAASDPTEADVEAETVEAEWGAHYQGGGGVGAALEVVESEPVVLEAGPRTVVVAGADAGPDAEELAHAGGFPLIAEIVSGARYGRHLVHGYRTLLSDAELGGRIERVVVFGHPTLSREVARLLSRSDVEVMAVRGPGEQLNLNGVTVAVDDVTAARGTGDRDWLGAWMRASRDQVVDLSPAAPDADALSSAVPAERLGAISAELGAVRAPVDRAALVDAVWRATWPHDRLLFGSSRLVRVADELLGGKKVPVHANRGLAGIDGTIATGLGIAAASQRGAVPGVTRVLLGDLAFLHDVGALLHPAAEDEPRIQVIVGNDGGGTIFDGLEVAGVASPPAFDRVQYTPQTARLEELARAYGWEYQRITTRGALDQALTSPAGGRQIIEVPLSR
ncbi:2-succinyl-5-enolpyruvyl-6-hydroxy-3-cyclohexene-1-carboxylic-acid synthase [Microbacterium sp. 77mftsu3.1]|uniref:2-succinyl-5-enolpyruvyl-6-hydroxy-3- cyclohexene-1-carboxylic-acid synthase n=1 Tax=Microbacterium sp. 77mftsu3.1 TaxID=1761802 RepID=UPI00037DDAB6|nr:2-succinyl-5-enolpyruvyl-6-hydroxy-3-cyclohexene-1-carboxylic-acid synthase [Microbacterium sp. 77mftsu3.1]SDG88923.1 2-succinyl-5-enolpyruvyl-6-hydroxy-3-cyclohexene-1-carboxylate synthase [Microbacterium sp. 77mftsu3.1]